MKNLEKKEELEKVKIFVDNEDDNSIWCYNCGELIDEKEFYCPFCDDNTGRNYKKN